MHARRRAGAPIPHLNGRQANGQDRFYSVAAAGLALNETCGMLPGGALNLSELQRLARERLTPMAYDYYASGAQDERTLHENAAAWSRIELHYRVLVDVA